MEQRRSIEPSVRRSAANGRSLQPIRVALVENDNFAKELISRLLEKCPLPIHITQRFDRGSSAIRFFQDPAHVNAVDVVLMDMHLGDIDGPHVSWHIRRLDDLTPILAVTSLPLKHYRCMAKKSGSQGLLPKKDIPSIAAAIVRLNNGYVYDGFDSPAVSSRRIQRQITPMQALTPIQTLVMELLSQNVADADIAAQLDCCKETVRKHRQNIVKRLEVDTIGEAVQVWKLFNRATGLS